MGVKQALDHPYFSDVVKNLTLNQNVGNDNGLNKNNVQLVAFGNVSDLKENEMRKIILEEVSIYNADGEGKCILFDAVCDFKLNVVLDGYARQTIEPLMNNNVIP